MKIAFCGVPTVGKTALIDKFVKMIPSYVKSSPKDPELYSVASRYDISKLDKIMDEFVNEAMFTEGKSNVVHDGCIIDALAHIYMFFGMNENAKTEILAKYHGLMYAAIQYYDVIFYIPYRTKYKKDLEKITKDEFLYLMKLDEFYSAIVDEWKKGNQNMFPFGSSMGCPPIIEVFGTTVDEQMSVLNLYVDENGNAVAPSMKSKSLKPGEENYETKIDEKD